MKQVLRLIAVPLVVGALACGSAPMEPPAPVQVADEAPAVVQPPAEEPPAAEPPAPSAPAAQPPAPVAKPKAPATSLAPQTAPAATPPPPAPAPVPVTILAGTELPVTLTTALDSKVNQIGDPLEGTTTAPIVIGDRVAIPAGSTVYGEVTDVVAAKKGLKVSEKGASVAIAFTRITTPDGVTSDFHASLVAQAKSGGKTGKIIGGSAAGGAVLGKVLGDKTKDTAAGAVIGTGIGAAIAAGTKGSELEIPAGSELIAMLDDDLTVSVD